MKTRYLTLDAMRGVAAIAVFFHHAGGISFPLSMPAGYRAVDLFFVLSGFVLAHAYGDALAQRQVDPWSFLIIRILRLYPLYLVGAVIGIGGAVIAVLLGGGDLSGVTVVIASLTLLLLLPSPTWNETSALMPLNIPSWSLVFELLANLVYALIAPHLGNKRLMLLIGSSGAMMAWSAIGAGNVNFGSEWGGIVGGLARVSFSFFVGVLLYRFHHRTAHVTPIAWLLVLIPLPLLFYWSEYVVADLICIILIFPLLIYTASQINVPFPRIAEILGDTSYGIYITHVPIILFVYKVFSYLGHNANNYAPWLGISVIIILMLGMIVIEFIYDRPARKILARYKNSFKRRSVER